MWQFLRDFHYYRPTEKRVIVVLLTLVVLTVTATVFYEQGRSARLSPTDTQALQTFADSLRQRDSVAQVRRAYYQNRMARPSTSSSYTSRNTVAHPSRRSTDRTAMQPRDTVRTLLLDTLPRYEKIEKYPEGTMVNLNKADTTELKKIPGIGSAIARLIVSYRNQLGGFYDVEQLKEINLDAAQLHAWFTVDEADIRKLAVNRLSVDRLRRHPYLSFYQAKALVEHRRKHGDLTSLKPFVLYEEFTEADLQRLSHYLSFD